jgi:hypothetical protein
MATWLIKHYHTVSTLALYLVILPWLNLLASQSLPQTRSIRLKRALRLDLPTHHSEILFMNAESYQFKGNGSREAYTERRKHENSQSAIHVESKAGFARLILSPRRFRA